MRTVIAGLAVVGMLALSGCVEGDPIPTLPPTPSSTPLFASEEEALAAAEEAYAEYLEVSSLIGSEGGVDPERIAPHVTERRLAIELEGFENLRDSGLRIDGSSTFETQQLQSFVQNDGLAEISFYVCWDGSGSRVLNEAGQDVTPPDRVDRLVLEVVMVTEPPSSDLLLSSDDQWPSSSC